MKSLSWYKKPYDIEKTETQFMKEMRENMHFQFENCEEYRALLEHRGWNEERIDKLESVAEIPFIPTLFFKHHRMDSVPRDKIGIRGKVSISLYNEELESIHTGHRVLRGKGVSVIIGSDSELER